MICVECLHFKRLFFGFSQSLRLLSRFVFGFAPLFSQQNSDLVFEDILFRKSMKEGWRLACLWKKNATFFRTFLWLLLPYLNLLCLCIACVSMMLLLMLYTNRTHEKQPNRFKSGKTTKAQQIKHDVKVKLFRVQRFSLQTENNGGKIIEKHYKYKHVYTVNWKWYSILRCATSEATRSLSRSPSIYSQMHSKRE